MSPIRSAVLLLLCAVVTLTIAAGTDCPAIGDMTKDTTNYTLTVSPSDVKNSTVYTVTFTSTTAANATVLFEVIADNNNIGNWSTLPNGFQNCTGAIYGSNTFSNGSSINATWTSPTALTATSIIFRALLNDTSGQYKVEKNASAAATPTIIPTTVNGSTVSMAPNSSVSGATVSMAPNSSSTVSMAPNSSSTVSMAPATTITTSGGHANHQAPMFFTLLETLIFLVATSKLVL